MNYSTTITLLALTGLLAGCGHPQIRPDDSSVTQHELNAQKSREEASQHEDLAVKSRPGRGGNPGPGHRLEAAKAKTHEQEHLAAAESLRRFEARECAGLSEEAKMQCPLATVEEVSELKDGVVLWFGKETDINSSLALVQCHLAYARTLGNTGMDDCPLFVTDLRATLYGPNALLVTTSNEKSSAELLSRLKLMYQNEAH